MATVPAVETLVEQRDGRTWSLRPAEAPATLDAITSQDVSTALTHAPASTRIELLDGMLCVWARGTIEDAATLDNLCAVAMCVASGVASPRPATPTPTPRSRCRSPASASARGGCS